MHTKPPCISCYCEAMTTVRFIHLCAHYLKPSDNDDILISMVLRFLQSMGCWMHKPKGCTKDWIQSKWMNTSCAHPYVLYSIFYIRDSWQSNVVWSHNHTSAFTTFKSSNYVKSVRKCKCYAFPLVSSSLFTHIGIFFELLQQVHGLKFHVTQGKVTESVCILDITDGETAGHRTCFHNCWTNSVSGVPAAGLQEF